MLVTVIGAVLIFFVLVFSLLRYTKGMAFVVGWILETVGWRTRVTVTEQSDPPKTSVKENSSKNSKPQQKTKKSEPPVFKTKLSTPVENAIAESIKDVKCKSPQPSTSKKKEIPKTSVTKQQDEKIKATQNKEKKENSNNSAKPTETKSEKSTKKIAKKDDTPQVSKTSKTEKSADDKVPFSPVKEKGKGKKKSTEDTKETKSTSSTVIEQTKKTKEDLSKPSIKKETTQAPEKSTEGTKETKSTSSTVIEQTKKTKQDLSKPSIKKETTQAPEKSTEGTKETKSTSSTVIEQTKKTKEDLSKPSIKKETTQAPEKVQVASTKSKQSPVNPPVEKSQVSKSKTDLKESKIVSSSISYANVVTNKVPEINGNAVNLKIEGKVVDSNLNSVKNKEQTKSEDINQKVQGFEKSDTQTKVVTELPSTTDLDVNSCSESEKLGSLTLDPKIPDLEKSFDPVENLSQQSYPGNLSSKSSSIEVIGEEQNVDSLNTSENHPENLDSFRQSEAPKQFETIKRDLLDLNSNLSSQTTSIYVPKSDEEKFKENKLESNGNKEAFTSVPTITASEKKETKESPENQSDFEESQLKALEELIEKESPLIQQSKPQEVIKVESSLVDNAAPFSNQEIKLEEFEVVEPVIQKSVAYLTYDNPETEIKENISSEAANANVTKEPQLLEDTEPELNLDEVAAKIELLLVPETEETRVSSSVEVSNDHFIEKPEGLESIVAEKVGSTQKIEIDSQKTEKLEESLEEKVEPKPQHLESVEGLTEERKESLLNLENKVKTEKDQVETDRLQLDEIKDSIVEREFLPSDISQEIEEKSEELGLTEKLVEEETETKPLFIPTEEIKISENSPFEVFSISTPQNLEEIEESTEERKESVTSLRTQENTQNYSFELSDTEAPLETQDLVEEKLQASLTHKTEDIVIDNIKYSYEIYTFNNPESENQQESVFFKETDCLRSDINDINNFFGNEENRSKEISINSSTAGVLGDTSENSFGNEENTSKEISANSSAAEVLEESSENFFGNEENKSKEISTNSSTAETLEETSEDFLGNEKNKSKEISTNSSTAEVLEETSENFFGNKENRSKEISTNSSTTEVLEETSENLFGNQENRSPKEISTNSSTAEILEETSENFFGNEVNRSPKETSKNSSTAEVLEETSENLFGKQENRSPEEISTNSSTTEVLEETSDDFLGNEENRSPKEISTNSSIAEVLEETSENPFNMATSQIRVLTLNNQEHQECTIYRIEKNWALQFRLGPSLFGRKVYLYCNYPVEKQGKLEEFQRDQYQLLTWVWDEGCKNADDTAAYTQIAAKLAGSFHYYFTFEKGHDAERQGSGFFLVDPVLKYGNDEDLPLDCIQCQTVLAKSLGSFSSWEQKLQVAKESGYNMIHFTPIQELGVSNSCYSLSEQLKLNPLFKKENGEMPKFEEIKQFASTMRKDWKVTSICDIVLNHTANESEWIKIHPEVTYNCVICPYMRPAYLLDAAFHQFSMDVKKGLYEDKGIPVEVSTEEHLNAIRYHFRSSVLEPLKIYELYICDTSKLAAEFFSLARNTPPVTRNGNTELPELRVLQDEEFRRLSSTVDLSLALKLYNVYRNDTFDEDSRLKRCTEDFKSKLDSLNSSIVEEINDHLTCAVENVLAGIRYFRVQPDGPRVKEITVKNPLVYRYFTDYGTPKSIKEHEAIMYSENGRFLMAHNGWVMNSDPLKNFAAPDSNVYIRRELIAWGDSVKLRYGNKPEDCPFLWEHMKKYVEQTAEIFDGVRLDNCHSTPIPVAEYLLDCARRVRPNLYVVAELFTNSDMTDNIFVNRLGITSLIREAMSAWDSHEEGRLVYRYGGSPVGSFYQPRVRPLVPSVAHALFLDLTHDNPSPVEKRSVFDLLPSTALVNMACCASGSNRGYDELVPHHIHVVDETRQYTEWTSDEDLARDNLRYVTKKSGIISAKRALNDIHFTLGKEGYNQVYVDQMDPDIVAVTRHRPDTHESYILVAFTAFGHPSEDSANYQRGIRPLRFEGTLDEIVVETSLSHVSTKSGGSKFARWEKFVKDSKWVNGLSEYEVTVKQHIQASESDIFDKVDSGTANVTQLNFKNFKPGSVVVIKASLPETMRDAIKTVRALMDQFSLTKETELSRIIDNMTLADLNRTLYRCDQEERDEGFGYDTYHIPNFGSLVYAGLQGFISPLANIRLNNDLGHPLCANLRDGNWMIEYIWKRLKLDDGTKHLGQWIEENTKCFNNIPRYLVPSYFDVIVTGLYLLLLEQSYKLMSKFVNHGSTFVRGLSMGSVQFAAYIKSADLPTLSPNLAPPKPPTRKNDKGEIVQTCLTLSAGLPHFSVGYTRNWGRDTFIALRGLFILTGRFEEARQHILGYGACLRHGLIPNLLDGGRNSRFNCRDAVWWWLYCIKEYVEGSPNGINILSDQVSRIFPTDASPAQPAGVVDQPLYDVMQEALKVHFQGLAFRERNAGRQIDAHMTDRGFNNQIGVHPETGFVFGGNEWNCGTWMDKMGSSDKAGNRGKPATPRDGSAIELIGLSKAVITWLWKLNQENKYPYNGVQRLHTNGSFTKWTFKEWSDKIQANFEKYYWVNSAPVPGEYRSDLINKRGIYKDTYGATQPWSDFQLRCNFPIAMVVAPELFNPQHAWIALKQAEKYLLGPLGMKTLDPEDWAYRGDYDNSNDSNDPSVAHGFNYHQGPEWVWPVGFFLRAKLHFASQNGALTETVASTKVVLSKHFTELQTSVWRGLPELTNSNGSYCRDSSRTQAWSMSCILEVLHDLQKIESKQPVLIN